MVSYNLALRQVSMGAAVLILVVVDDGLVPAINASKTIDAVISLNPCCSGRWSRTDGSYDALDCSQVLILVVVDDGLVLDLIRLF